MPASTCPTEATLKCSLVCRMKAAARLHPVVDDDVAHTSSIMYMICSPKVAGLSTRTETSTKASLIPEPHTAKARDVGAGKTLLHRLGHRTFHLRWPLEVCHHMLNSRGASSALHWLGQCPPERKKIMLIRFMLVRP